MSPMYNPDDYNENQLNTMFKYEPMSTSTVNKILIQYRHDEVLDYIKQLWNLIDYQKKLLNEQTQKIVALKHKEAWKTYDKNNNPTISQHIDKT